MELTDEAKAERLERQQQELERRRKIRNSRLFLFFGTVFEILETFLVIASGRSRQYDWYFFSNRKLFRRSFSGLYYLQNLRKFCD